jgi:hypothetical protein
MNLKDEKKIHQPSYRTFRGCPQKTTIEERQLVKILTMEGSDHLEEWDGKVHGLRVNGRILV